MQSRLATLIKNELKDLPFINKLGGLVYTQTENIPSIGAAGSQQNAVKRFPCTTDVWLRQSNEDISNKIIDFVPDSSNVGMVYFEPTSDIREVSRNSRYTRYNCGYRLVFWGNSNMINHSCNLSEQLQRQIINVIKGLDGKTLGKFVCVIPRIVGISSDNSIFNRYTYDELITQYLMPPFVYFAINIDVSFYSSDSCSIDVKTKISKC